MSQLALQLIQQEKDAKTGHLDLGFCGLTPNNPQLQDVWDALGELMHLETLILSNSWYDSERDTWRDSQNKGDKNLLDNIPTAITNLLNLKKLVIAGRYSEKWKISKLENLPQNLQKLYIDENKIIQLENLPQKLTTLRINNNNIWALENLTNKLTKLYVNNNKIQILECLPKNIHTLDISYNQIEKIENLPQNLHTLNIRHNPIGRIENLPEKLCTLDISYSLISDLSPLIPLIEKGLKYKIIKTRIEHNLKFAKYLIAKEKVEKTGYLDLGRCGLTPETPQLQVLWEALSELVHLETLIISNQWLDPEKKEMVYSQNGGERNLLKRIPKEINDLINLKKLWIAGDYPRSGRWQIHKIENLPKNITTLEIRNNLIPKIENLPKNLRKLYISHNQIQKLENLPDNLDVLHVDNNIVAILENLPQSISQLYISENGIRKLEDLPQSISQLYIRENDIRKLENLPQSISQLDISENRIRKLENLPQSLKLFDISSNVIRDLSPLIPFLERGLEHKATECFVEHTPKYAKYLIAKEKVEKTGYLDLGSCGLSSNDPELQDVWDALKKAVHLDTLALSGEWRKSGYIKKDRQNRNNINWLNKIPRAIADLMNLKTLIIGNGVITKLENLPQNITTLYISGNQLTKLENLPQSISQLYISENQITKLENLPQNIETLYINRNQLTKLENLPQNVEILYINHNQLTKLENLPQSISQLYISENQITKLENLPQNISKLDVSYNQIKDLKPLLPFIKKDIVYRFKGNKIENPPNEVVNQGREAILRYFEELEKSGETQVKEAKLLLTGSGEVGKTSLRYRLNDKTKELPKKEERTKQIDVDKYSFPISKESDFTAHIWDFGGQQIIHHFHRFYMNDSSLYILLTETSRENDDFDYWLQTIQLYGKESPILFVQNKRNGMPRSLDISHYQNDFNIKDELYNVNLLNNEGLNELENAIRYYIQKLPHTQRTIPRSWLGIREALDRLKGDSGGYITFEKFREICREQDITDRAKIEDVGQFLHRLGVLLWYKNNPVLRQKIILERHWATEGIFKLVFDQEIQKTGHFSFAQVQTLWDTDDAYSHHTNDLIALMREFKICFPRKSQPDHYIIPALLTATAPHVEWKAYNRMTVEYYYPTILPRGLMNYLTAEMYDDILDDAHAWSAGVWLHAGDTQAKIEENRFHRKISITLSGSQHRELFGGIKKVIDNIHKDYPGMKPELRIPCICPTCAAVLQTNKEYYEYSDIIRRLERHKRTVECRKSYDDVLVKDLLNHILAPRDYGNNREDDDINEAKRIFVSYSHKDMAYKERLETAFAVQVRNGKVEIWNDQEILGGEDWNEEIFEHLESADIIVLLFSPDFFASNFIWEKELPVVMRRYRNKSAKVFPVLLRPCDWMDTEYGKIQAVPSEDGQLKAISQWDDEDEAWQTVVQSIKKAIHQH